MFRFVFRIQSDWYPITRRNPFDDASNDTASHRTAISPLYQCFTRAIRWRAAECELSMMFVVPRHRFSIGGRSNSSIVNSSSSPSRSDAAALLQAFPPPEHYLSEAAMRAAIEQRGQFNIIHIPSGLKVDMIVLRQDDYSQLEIQRGRRLTSPGEFDVWFAAPEDVILNKLVYYREGGSEKHLRDITSMLVIQGAAIDRGYIPSWSVQLGVVAEWETLLADLAE